MGQEIADSRFSAEDFDCFSERLKRETRLLESWFRDCTFCEEGHAGGFELETWLVGRDGLPAPVNEAVLDTLKDPLVVPELARFNLELNGQPVPLQGDALSRLHLSLKQVWERCAQAAELQGARLMMVGILPSAREGDFTLGNMSPLQRYHALDEQLYELRGGHPLEIDIEGSERLRFVHDDVMLESATTSFQIHLKVNASHAVRFYNAAKIVSAPMVAVAANSPYLFGADLWDETRIPLFEQAVRVGASDLTKRVSFGIRYLRETMMECFQANLERYPVLLPRCMEVPDQQLAHLRLHNGTIWRWNRPLIGFSESGQPHLRIEHRVLPAGPSMVDAIANMALFFGLVYALANQPEPPESRLEFVQARENFYRAAREGLQARLQWLDGKTVTARELCLEVLLPQARTGLERMGLDRHDADGWLSIIRHRLESGQTGAVWQRAWVRQHGRGMPALVEAYLQRQNSGAPVHQWTL